MIQQKVKVRQIHNGLLDLDTVALSEFASMDMSDICKCMPGDALH